MLRTRVISCEVPGTALEYYAGIRSGDLDVGSVLFLIGCPKRPPLASRVSDLRYRSHNKSTRTQEFSHTAVVVLSVLVIYIYISISIYLSTCAPCVAAQGGRVLSLEASNLQQYSCTTVGVLAVCHHFLPKYEGRLNYILM